MSFTQNTNATREETHVCTECGTEFTRIVKAKALTGKNHFCSRKCSRVFYRRKELKGVEFAERTGICRHCGKPFTFRVESYKKECFWPHYCQEPECRAEYERMAVSRRLSQEKRKAEKERKKKLDLIKKEKLRHRKAALAGRKAAKIRLAKKKHLATHAPRKCECCGREFVPDRTHPNARFCSKDCQKTAYQKVRRRKYVSKPAPEPRACRWCGAVFVPSKSHPTAEFCKYDHARRFRYNGNRSEVQVAYDRAEALTHAGPGRKRPKLTYAVVRKCRKCGKEFTATASGQFYCSAECKSASKGKAVPTLRTCKVCGKEFMGVGTRTTCSKECSYANRSRRGVFQNGQRRIAVEKVRVVCAECGREFEYERKGRTRLRRYCSDACCRKYQNRRMTELNREATAEGNAVRARVSSEKLAEKAKERAERQKEREEERMTRILAVREKRRLVKEESARRRAENLAKHAEKIKENAERRRKTAAESAARKRAAARAKAAAERAVLVAKAREEGRKVETAVCKECGQEFEYLTGVRPGYVPEFCCDGCRGHWRYEHGGRERAKARMEKIKAEGGRWNGRHFEKARKKENLRITWRGQCGFCSGTRCGPDRMLAPEDIPIENPEEAFEYGA